MPLKWSTFTEWISSFEGIVFCTIIILFFIFIISEIRKKKGENYEMFTTDIKVQPIKKRKGKKRRGKGRSYEGRVRKILQELYNKPFQSIRPDWLKNPETGRNLEIDCYDDDIQTIVGKGLGIEVDGEAHFKYTEYFHKSPQDFIQQVKRDKMKDEMCEQHGLLLIRVPYFVMVASDEEIKSFIKEKMEGKILSI
jgi:hypothetical protein